MNRRDKIEALINHASTHENIRAAAKAALDRMDDAVVSVDDLYLEYELKYGRPSIATKKEIWAICILHYTLNERMNRMHMLVGTPCITNKLPPAIPPPRTIKDRVSSGGKVY